MTRPTRSRFTFLPTALLMGTSVLVAGSGCLSGSDGSVCEEARTLSLECAGAASEIDFGDCTGELREAAEAIVSQGCEGLKSSKSDVTSQLCIGPLRDFFPWCSAEAYRCEPTGAQLNGSQCNGSAALCDRPFDQVVFPTSHNAFSAATMGFLRPNQSKRMYVQLRDGMRGLMVDSRRASDGSLAMCHLDCALGETSFEDGLREVLDFLECHPNEVLVLIIEPHAPGSEHVAAFEAIGLDRFAFTHEVGAPWPTLGEMIDSGKRLVVLAEKPGIETPAWYHHQWEHAFDNEFSVKKPEDFACEVKRGDASNTNNALFGLNHFVTVLGGDEFLAKEPNRAANIHDHVEQCRDVFGKVPSFIAVDFHDIGDTAIVARELNER